MNMDKAINVARTVLGYVSTLLILALIILVAAGRVKVAVVEGISMEPTMHTGDLVFLEKKAPDKIDVGDVVVYHAGSKYIIHRVIKIYKNNGRYCYVVKGDNNPVPDPGFPQCGYRGIPYDAILGVVYSVHNMPVKIPYIGGISVVLKG